MVEDLADRQRMDVRLYTDSYVVRGWIATTHRHVVDLLSVGDQESLVLEEVSLTELSTGDVIRQSAFAKVNLTTVLFGLSETPIDAVPEFPLPRLGEKALVIVPPFRLTGFIRVIQEADLRGALAGLTGRFLPVTDVAYWSEVLREPRTTAELVAVNLARAQIFAPYHERDVWGDSPGGGGAPGAGDR